MPRVGAVGQVQAGAGVVGEDMDGDGRARRVAASSARATRVDGADAVRDVDGHLGGRLEALRVGDAVGEAVRPYVAARGRVEASAEAVQLAVPWAGAPVATTRSASLSGSASLSSTSIAPAPSAASVSSTGSGAWLPSVDLDRARVDVGEAVVVRHHQLGLEAPAAT